MATSFGSTTVTRRHPKFFVTTTDARQHTHNFGRASVPLSPQMTVTRMTKKSASTAFSPSALALFALVATVLTTTSATTSSELPPATEAEKLSIKRWLEEQEGVLNRYGDAVDTVYAGGTPLFDENTVGPDEQRGFV